MKRNQTVRTVLYVLAAALLSLPTALWFEGFGLQHQLLVDSRHDAQRQVFSA
jgi:hypothetical protein